MEERYLAGHAALFPDYVTAWEEQLTRSETFSDLAVRLAEMDGVPPAEPVEADDAAARVTELIADLVEPAKATALQELGEGERAHSIAIGWLRAKLRVDEGIPEERRPHGQGSAEVVASKNLPVGEGR